jgi:hypothetical protein
MSGSHNKNIIFYSNFPHDQLSRVFLAELDKKPALSKQFIRICVHHPHDITQPNPLVTLPNMIQQLIQKTPIIAVAGYKKLVFAQEALSWLKSTALNQGAHINDIKDGSGLLAANIHGSKIADNCSSIEQAGQMGSEFFNTEYNMGFSTGEGEIGKDYASIRESSENRIVTYDDDNTKGDVSQETNRRMNELKSQRMTEVPPPISRVGGLPQQGNNGNGNGGYGNSGYSNSGYGNSMPQMPQMPGYNNNRGDMPQMPNYGQQGYGQPGY